MDESSDDKTRKTVSLTHKQIGATGLVAMVVTLTPYFKDVFVSKAEGEKISVELEYLQAEVKNLKESVDKFPDRIEIVLKDNMKQVHRDLDRNEKRIENLEVYAFKSKKSAIY